MKKCPGMLLRTVVLPQPGFLQTEQKGALAFHMYE